MLRSAETKMHLLSSSFRCWPGFSEVNPKCLLLDMDKSFSKNWFANAYTRHCCILWIICLSNTRETNLKYISSIWLERKATLGRGYSWEAGRFAKTQIRLSIWRWRNELISISKKAARWLPIRKATWHSKLHVGFGVCRQLCLLVLGQVS